MPLRAGWSRGEVCLKLFRKVLFWIHLAVGISVGLVVFIMSVTGVALTYQRQTQAWADGFDVRPADATVERMPVARLLRQVRDEQDANPSALLLRNDPSRPARVSFGRQSFEVDPYTGERLGAGAVGVRKAFRALISWHRWLGQEGEGRVVARAITGFCNLAFLFIVISGLYLWWPKSWRWSHLRSIVFFRRGLAPRPRHFNWHNVIGLWTAIPLVIVVATGTFFYYSWPSSLVYWITGEERPQRASRSAPGDSEEPPPPDDYEGMDALVLAALEEEPAWNLATFRFAPHPEAPVTVTLDRSPWGTRVDQRTTLVMDRATATVLGEDAPGRASRARTWIRWLHTGEAFGFVGQTIAGIASLAGCFLVYTGWSLSWRRFVAWRQRRTAYRPDAVRESGAGPLPPPIGGGSALPRPVSVFRVSAQPDR